MFRLGALIDCLYLAVSSSRRCLEGAQPMENQPFVVTPEDYDRALNVVGTEVTILASNAATESYEITFQKGDEGTGPPPHSHDWDEAFFIIKGSVEFSYGKKTMLALPGTLVHLPAGTVHGFQYGAGGGEMLEITGSGSLASKMFTAVDREIPPGPPDSAKVVEVLKKNGVTLAE
jgi:quercetin dioxygenase-like cupin family protein